MDNRSTQAERPSGPPTDRSKPRCFWQWLRIDVPCHIPPARPPRAAIGISSKRGFL
ncbi:hypothetical protein ASPZODRAFT_133732 [Penicilliopsis zonata CBS 506.65]|uniref:Uncharacterized protein n=1 Tax=Penicilliopsis zonata CBS 506.65 TaxID=1073090 RepID=A0A1L9SFI0_9EURO|nr:hypothetical protein ASPZODRAFT_133732 [Penicilliopsis zonata CBS 506.65]OJJ45863.1 hypothetical protein ASPZODRAFT_133732 [Penicilliopsis zonata CBS 506.65]